MFICVDMFRRVISRVLSAEAHSRGTENTKQRNGESNSKNETFGCYWRLGQVSPAIGGSVVFFRNFLMILRCWKLSLGLMCARQVLYHWMSSLSPWYLKMLIFETGAYEITHTGLNLALFFFFFRQLWTCLSHLCGWVCATRPDPGSLIYGCDGLTSSKDMDGS